MASSAHHEALWEAIPPGREPADFALRLSFLLADVAAGEHVLDLGCGEGRFASELARSGARVVAVDVAEEPLRRARERDQRLDLRLLGGESAWDLPDAAFDVVWAGEVIEHVADTAGWLSEVRRVLRSGGRLLLSTPAHGPLTRLHMGLSERAFTARLNPLGDHLHLYTRSSLSRLIAGFGFDEVSVRSAGGWPGARRLLLARAVRARY